jgi:hypothetical protein
MVSEFAGARSRIDRKDPSNHRWAVGSRSVRSVPKACATVTLARVPGTHMFLVESPAQTAAVIAEAAASPARTSRIVHERQSPDRDVWAGPGRQAADT